MRILLFSACALVFEGCAGDPVGVTPGSGVIVRSDAELIDVLAAVYRDRDAQTLEVLLADRDGAEFLFVGGAIRYGDVAYWGAERERQIHRRMFDPDTAAGSQPPVAPELRILEVQLQLTPTGDFTESPGSYRSAQNPSGLDADRWRATEARYKVGLWVVTEGYAFHGTRGFATFVVAEDRRLPVGAPGKYLLSRWEDDTGSSQPQKVVPSDSWTRIKRAYAGDQESDGAVTVVQALTNAYQNLDVPALQALIEPDGDAAFRFELAGVTPDGRNSWDAATELLAHQRMFHPETAHPSIDPPRLVPKTIQVTLEPQTAFVESQHLDPHLDPKRWALYEATYSANVDVELQNGDVLEIRGRSHFSILEDLEADAEARRFILYRWKELEPAVASQTLAYPVVDSFNWSELKQLFLPRPPIHSETALIQSLEFDYWARSMSLFTSLLALGPEVGYEFVRDRADPQTNETTWNFGDEFMTHSRMFSTDVLLVPQEEHLRHARTHFVPQGEFTEQSDYYCSTSNPTGLDPDRWRVTAAVFDTQAVFETAGLEYYSIRSPVRFVVLQDLSRAPGEERRFLLHRWEDLAPGTNPSASRISWTDLRLMYQP